MAYQIKTSLNETRQKHTEYCPKCGTRSPTRQVADTQDFDDKGWFNPVTMTCSASLCGHTWIEKVYVLW